MITFAECGDLDGCGLTRDDNLMDVCVTDPKVFACEPFVPADCGTHLRNGTDVTLGVFAYDRAARTLYLGIRIPEGQAIGDADGGGTWNQDCVQGVDTNIVDETGIGMNEVYHWFLDTNCDEVPDVTVSVFNNDVHTPSGTATFVANNPGRDLEVMVENIDLPQIVAFRAFAGFTFDGQSEDFTAWTSCPEPNPNIIVECDGPAELCQGATGDYTITVTNNGEAILDPVSLTVTLPSGLSFDQFVNEDGWDNCGEGGGIITCSEAGLPPGEARDVIVRLVADADCLGSKELTTEATGLFFQEGCADFPVANSSSCVVECLPSPQVPSCEASGPDLACAGGDYTITVEVVNNNPDPVDLTLRTQGGDLVMTWTNVEGGGTRSIDLDRTMDDPCPSDGVTECFRVTATNDCGDSDPSDLCCVTVGCDGAPEAPNCEATGPTQVCENTAYEIEVCVTNKDSEAADLTLRTSGGDIIETWEDVPAGGERCITVDRDAPADCSGKDIGECFEVYASNDCGDSDVGECCVEIACSDGPCVELEIEATPDSLCPGGSAKVTVTGTATNCSGATETIVIRRLDGTVIETCKDVAPDGTCEFTDEFEFDVPGDCPADGIEIEYCADASVELCPEPATDCASDFIHCFEPGVEITKVAEPTTQDVGSPYTVTLTIENTGNSVLDPVQVCDLLPAGVGFDDTQIIGGTCGVSVLSTTPVGDGLEVCFTEFSLDPGESCTIVYELTCDVEGEQTDVVTVTGYCSPGGTDEVTDTDEATVTCEAVANEGCTPGFWKNNPNCWCDEFSPGDLVGDVFDIPAELSALADDTLMEALNYGGGGNLIGKARNLLRHAVAAILNSCNDNVEFPADTDEIIEMVNDALATLDQNEITRVQGVLAGWNELGCPIDAHCRLNDDDKDDTPESSPAELTREQLEALELFTPIPNPFTEATSLVYSVGSDGEYVQIEVHDAAGRKVRSLKNGFQSAGRHQVIWDGRSDSGTPVPSGVYFYRAVLGDKAQTIRVIYAR